jgi:hypothetical protein
MPIGRRADQNIVEYSRHSKAYRSRMLRQPYTYFELTTWYSTRLKSTTLSR